MGGGWVFRISKKSNVRQSSQRRLRSFVRFWFWCRKRNRTRSMSDSNRNIHIFSAEFCIFPTISNENEYTAYTQTHIHTRKINKMCFFVAFRFFHSLLDFSVTSCDNDSIFIENLLVDAPISLRICMNERFFALTRSCRTNDFQLKLKFNFADSSILVSFVCVCCLKMCAAWCVRVSDAHRVKC